MTKQRIFTVGFELPGDELEHIEFDSDQTLLDADIILFRPTLGHCGFAYEEYGGKPILSEHSSFATKGYLNHWRSEIVAAFNAGKIVVVYLVKPVEYCRYTGEKRFSGTGRSRVTTNIVTNVSSYEAVPNLKKVTPKSGSAVRLEKEGAFLGSYWSEFSGPYEVEIEGDFKRVLLRAKAGDRVVGAAVHGKNGGAFLLLPPLAHDEETFVCHAEDEQDEAEPGPLHWTEDAIKFGKRLTAALVALADALKQSVQTTPPPGWSSASKYRLAAETEMELAISKRAAAIVELQTEKVGLEGALKDLGRLRWLLYEQGKPLEAAVLEAMALFGFEAQPFSDGSSEFDGVFVSAEGRCLGEVEGKDNKAINIEKFSQLERNLQEDFGREEVTEYAKGVLFGNANRLMPVDERPEFFTEKCVSAAKRIEAALVRTPDLFAPAKYLKENPSDLDYAKKCRESVFAAKGEIVEFPPTPILETTAVAENVAADESRGPNVEIGAT